MLSSITDPVRRLLIELARQGPMMAGEEKVLDRLVAGGLTRREAEQALIAANRGLMHDGKVYHNILDVHSWGMMSQTPPAIGLDDRGRQLVHDLGLHLSDSPSTDPSTGEDAVDDSSDGPPLRLLASPAQSVAEAAALRGISPAAAALGD